MAKKSNKKTIITVSIILAVLAIAYLLYKRYKKKKAGEAVESALDTFTGAFDAIGNVTTTVANGVLNIGQTLGEAVSEASQCGCNSTYTNQLDEVSIQYPGMNLNGCGPAVAQFQTFLNDELQGVEGFSTLVTDCRYGDNTLEAHKIYLLEQEVGQDATGQLDAEGATGATAQSGEVRTDYGNGIYSLCENGVCVWPNGFPMDAHLQFNPGVDNSSSCCDPNASNYNSLHESNPDAEGVTYLCEPNALACEYDSYYSYVDQYGTEHTLPA